MKTLVKRSVVTLSVCAVLTAATEAKEPQSERTQPETKGEGSEKYSTSDSNPIIAKLHELKKQYRSEVNRSSMVTLGFEEKLARKDREIRELKAVIQSLALQLEKAETKIYQHNRSGTNGNQPQLSQSQRTVIQRVVMELDTDAENLSKTIAPIEIVEQLDPIYFSYRTAVNYPERQRILSKLISLQNQSNETKFKLVGHADDYYHAETNQDVSENRAKFLANFLQANGIDADRLIAEGRGNTQPTNDPNRPNRRVEIHVIIK